MESLNIYITYELENQREKLSQEYFVSEPRINMWKVMLDMLDNFKKSIEGISQAADTLSETNKTNEKTSVYLKGMGKDALEINKNLNMLLRNKPDLSEITESVYENARDLSYIALLKEKPKGEA